MAFRIVIPARYHSTRLPGKPLCIIQNKPLIQHVYERALQCGASEVVIATDDQRIFDVAKALGATVCLTSVTHPTGTDRLAEVAAQFAWSDDDCVINIQGDEPLIPLLNVQQVAKSLNTYPDADMATLCQPILDHDELMSPHSVKVVFDHQGYALYFSRSPIPWQQGAKSPLDFDLSRGLHYRHIGLYGYRVRFLRAYQQWSSCSLESYESLEQLRALWQGKKIHVSIAAETTPADVNTPEDLEKVRKILGG